LARLRGGLIFGSGLPVVQGPQHAYMSVHQRSAIFGGPLQLGAMTARAHMISLTDTAEFAADANDRFEEWVDR